jgi:hypothetical protein
VTQARLHPRRAAAAAEDDGAETLSHAAASTPAAGADLEGQLCGSARRVANARSARLGGGPAAPQRGSLPPAAAVDTAAAIPAQGVRRLHPGGRPVEPRGPRGAPHQRDQERTAEVPLVLHLLHSRLHFAVVAADRQSESTGGGGRRQGIVIILVLHNLIIGFYFCLLKMDLFVFLNHPTIKAEKKAKNICVSK